MDDLVVLRRVTDIDVDALRRCVRHDSSGHSCRTAAAKRTRPTASSKLAPVRNARPVTPCRSALRPARSARLGFHNTMADSCLAKATFCEAAYRHRRRSCRPRLRREDVVTDTRNSEQHTDLFVKPDISSILASG